MRQDQRIDTQPLVTQIAQHIVTARRADVHQRRLPPVAENRRVALPHVKLNIARVGRKAGQIADQKDAERRRKRPSFCRGQTEYGGCTASLQQSPPAAPNHTVRAGGRS